MGLQRPVVELDDRPVVATPQTIAEPIRRAHAQAQRELDSIALLLESIDNVGCVQCYVTERVHSEHESDLVDVTDLEVFHHLHLPPSVWLPACYSCWIPFVPASNHIHHPRDKPLDTDRCPYQSIPRIIPTLLGFLYSCTDLHRCLLTRLGLSESNDFESWLTERKEQPYEFPNYLIYLLEYDKTRREKTGPRIKQLEFRSSERNYALQRLDAIVQSLLKKGCIYCFIHNRTHDDNEQTVSLLEKNRTATLYLATARDNSKWRFACYLCWIPFEPLGLHKRIQQGGVSNQTVCPYADCFINIIPSLLGYIILDPELVNKIAEKLKIPELKTAANLYTWLVQPYEQADRLPNYVHYLLAYDDVTALAAK